MKIEIEFRKNGTFVKSDYLDVNLEFRINLDGDVIFKKGNLGKFNFEAASAIVEFINCLKMM